MFRSVDVIRVGAGGVGELVCSGEEGDGALLECMFDVLYGVIVMWRGEGAEGGGCSKKGCFAMVSAITGKDER